MDMERINPSGLARPSGFSHAVSAPAGRLVFLAGQIGMDRDGSSRLPTHFDGAPRTRIPTRSLCASRTKHSAGRAI